MDLRYSMDLGLLMYCCTDRVLFEYHCLNMVLEYFVMKINANVRNYYLRTNIHVHN